MKLKRGIEILAQFRNKITFLYGVIWITLATTSFFQVRESFMCDFSGGQFICARCDGSVPFAEESFFSKAKWW